MHLTYRAARYQLNSHIAKITESEMTGIYRGAMIKFQVPQVIPQPQSSILLKYRGSSYTCWR